MLNKTKLEEEIYENLKSSRSISLWKSSLGCDEFVKTLTPEQKRLFYELFNMEQYDRDFRDKQVISFTLDHIRRMFSPPKIYFD